MTEPTFGRYFELFDLTDIANSMKGNKTPLLVLVGEHDPAITLDLMNKTFLAWFANAKVEVVSNSGHYPMQETPFISRP